MAQAGSAGSCAPGGLPRTSFWLPTVCCRCWLWLVLCSGTWCLLPHLDRCWGCIVGLLFCVGDGLLIVSCLCITAGSSVSVAWRTLWSRDFHTSKLPLPLSLALQGLDWRLWSGREALVQVKNSFVPTSISRECATAWCSSFLNYLCWFYCFF